MALLSFIDAEEWLELARAFGAMQTCTHATGDRERFAPLWSDWEFDAVLRFVPLPQPDDFRLIRAGKPLPSSLYRDRHGAVQPSAVHQLWATGVSMVLVSVDCYSDRLLALGRFLETELRCPVQINLYATPGRSQGLGAHVDRHDVLVLQVRGEKTWHVDAPGPISRGTPAGPGGRQTVVLRSGDWLYVPKGVPHEVRNDGAEPSVHLAVGFYPLTWADVAQDGLDRARLVTPPLRERIPFGATTAESAAATGARLASLLAHLDPVAKARSYFAQFPALGAPVPPGASPAQIAAADAQTRFAWRQGEVAIDASGGRLWLRRACRRFPLELRPQLEPIVKAMSERGPFRGGDLAADAGDDPLALCRLLANVGVLDLPDAPR